MDLDLLALRDREAGLVLEDAALAATVREAGVIPPAVRAALLAGRAALLSPAPRVATLPFQMVTGCRADCVFCNYPRRLDVLGPERRRGSSWTRPDVRGSGTSSSSIPRST